MDEVSKDKWDELISIEVHFKPEEESEEPSEGKKYDVILWNAAGVLFLVDHVKLRQEANRLSVDAERNKHLAGEVISSFSSGVEEEAKEQYDWDEYL